MSDGPSRPWFLRGWPAALVMATLLGIAVPTACAHRPPGEPQLAIGAHNGPSRVPSTSPSPAVGQACGQVSEILVPSCGAWFGVWARTRGNGEVTTDLAGNLASIEARLGRQLDLTSRYYGWGELPPDETDLRWRDTNHLVLVDLRARNFQNNRYTPWREIASGAHDAYLTTVANRLRSYGHRLFFSFNQEPEQELEKGPQVAGTPEEYAAAYRRIHDVFDRAGATNVVWVWWTMGYLGHAKWYHALYPGDSYVDWVSYDPYDFNACRNVAPKSARQSVAPFYTWLNDSGLGTGKPVMLSEYGSHGVRPEWYGEFGAVVKSLPRIKAVVSFNSAPGGCDTRVTASDDKWRAFVGLAEDPYFRQTVRQP